MTGPTETSGLRILSGARLRQRLGRDPRSGGIVIQPLLDPRQVSLTTVDLRLGTEFQVSLRTRNPAIDTHAGAEPGTDVPTLFERTYRDFGDRFVLYPMHFVLGSSFEYLRMPNDVCAELHARSSLSRAGVNVRGFVQPGYMGVLTLELANDSGNTLLLYPGMRAVQMTFYEVEDPTGTEYVKSEAAKYLGGVGPQLSRIRKEEDWQVLARMRSQREA